MIKTFDNKEWKEEDLLKEMYDDNFYYGYLGKYALSSSSLKKILKDIDEFILEQTMDSTAGNSQPMRDGRLIHLVALEPHKIKDLTIIDSTKGSKQYKEAVEKEGSANVYTSRELNRCYALGKNVEKDFEAYLLLDGAKKEVPGIMMYRGLPIRGKADILKVKEDHVIDIKTTGDSSRFEQSIDMFGYDLQGALYLKMFDCSRFTFIILDKTTGEISIRELTEEELKRGQEKLEKAIDIYKVYYEL